MESGLTLFSLLFYNVHFLLFKFFFSCFFFYKKMYLFLFVICQGSSPGMFKFSRSPPKMSPSLYSLAFSLSVSLSNTKQARACLANITSELNSAPPPFSLILVRLDWLHYNVAQQSYSYRKLWLETPLGYYSNASLKARRNIWITRKDNTMDLERTLHSGSDVLVL